MTKKVIKIFGLSFSHWLTTMVLLFGSGAMAWGSVPNAVSGAGIILLKVLRFPMSPLITTIGLDLSGAASHVLWVVNSLLWGVVLYYVARRVAARSPNGASRLRLVVLSLWLVGISSFILVAIVSADNETPCLSSNVPSGLQLAAGDTTILTAGVLNRRAEDCVPTMDHNFEWVTSAPKTFTVSEHGLLHALQPGEGRVTIRDGWHQESLNVRVIPPIDSMALKPRAAIISVGDTLQYTFEAYGTNGEVITDLAFRLRVSDREVARQIAGRRNVFELVGQKPGQTTIQGNALINRPAYATLSVIDTVATDETP